MLLCAVWLAAVQPGFAYGVFTHQQLIDIAWTDSIRPLLLSRYPGTSEAQLREAHAFAYGGCVIQDLGYYPFSHEFFSDLTHYVRSGDFIDSLFRNAQNVDEYAFAIGALSHYVGDSIGHQVAVNPATAIEFPNLRKKFGDAVTYQNSPHAHIRTEFGFDIDQMAAHRFAPQGYVDYIGFRVALRLLRQAFRETYGLELREVLGPTFPAAKSYRSSVRKFIPLFAYGEVVIHHHHFHKDIQNQAFEVYMENLSRAIYEKRWAHDYKSPGIGAHVMAIFIPILPRIGPLSLLAIKDPRPETQDLYIQSVDRSVEHFRAHLDKLRAEPQTALALPNRDLDTGERVKPGAYILTDKTYAELLHRITSDDGRIVRPGVERDILAYYADPSAPIETKRHKKAWKRVLAQLDELKRMKQGVSQQAASAADAEE